MNRITKFCLKCLPTDRVLNVSYPHNIILAVCRHFAFFHLFATSTFPSQREKLFDFKFSVWQTPTLEPEKDIFFASSQRRNSIKTKIYSEILYSQSNIYVIDQQRGKKQIKMQEWRVLFRSSKSRTDIFSAIGNWLNVKRIKRWSFNHWNVGDVFLLLDKTLKLIWFNSVD